MDNYIKDKQDVFIVSAKDNINGKYLIGAYSTITKARDKIDKEFGKHCRKEKNRKGDYETYIVLGTVVSIEYVLLDN